MLKFVAITKIVLYIITNYMSSCYLIWYFICVVTIIGMHVGGPDKVLHAYVHTQYAM